MGEAKRRGTYEQRVKCAIAANAVIEKTFPIKEQRQKALHRCGGDTLMLAMMILERHKELGGK